MLHWDKRQSCQGFPVSGLYEYEDFITKGLHGLFPVASIADFLLYVYLGPHGTQLMRNRRLNNVMNDTVH